MPLVATVTCVMYHEVHLLLDDIAVVAVEGNKRYVEGLRMQGTPFCTFQYYTTVISSREVH